MAVTCVPMPPCFFALPLRQIMLPFIGPLPVSSQILAITQFQFKEREKLTAICGVASSISHESVSREGSEGFKTLFPFAPLARHPRQFLRAFPAHRPYLPPLMAIIEPFPALRPKPELAGRICELPYDVMSSDEARQLAAGNPLSFLHVSKPEIDLPPGTDLYSPAVYAKGRENFQALIAQ